MLSRSLARLLHSLYRLLRWLASCERGRLVWCIDEGAGEIWARRIARAYAHDPSLT